MGMFGDSASIREAEISCKNARRASEASDSSLRLQASGSLMGGPNGQGQARRVSSGEEEEKSLRRSLTLERDRVAARPRAQCVVLTAAHAWGVNSVRGRRLCRVSL